jgi:hypothetical protein
MRFVADNLDVIILLLFGFVVWVSYRIGRASCDAEIQGTLREVETLREKLHEIKSSQHLSVGNHPAGIRLVRE